MGTRAGVGTSNHRNPRVAGKEAALRAMQEAGTTKPSFVLVFSAVGYDQQVLLDAVRGITGDVPLCGCSGEGVIAQRLADEGNFVVGIMVVFSDELRMTCGLATGLRKEPAQVGKAVAQALANEVRKDTLALLLFADGLTCNYDHFISGLYSQAPELQHIPILGGFSGENHRMIETFQYSNESVISDGVSWALIAGSARLATAVNHGCVPIGSERVITRCSGGEIQEIDGQPALSILKEYVSDADVAESGDAILPLAFGFTAPQQLDEPSQLVLRSVRGKNSASGAITLPSDVSTGQRFWMARRDTEAVEAGLNQVCDHISKQLNGAHPKLVLQFDCASRGKLLFREEQKLSLLQQLQRGVSSTTPWLGMYTYGEFGPVNQQNGFHCYTVVMAVFY